MNIFHKFLLNGRLSDEGDAVEKFMHCALDYDSDVSVNAYTAACPRHQLPSARVPIILVTGLSDSDVPSDMVEEFFEAAKIAEPHCIKVI